MFSDIDEALRQLLTAGIPIRAGEIDISFERPTREWSSKLSRPTINLFLYDIRERAELQNMPFEHERAPGSNVVVRRRTPRRLDVAYLVTAWTRDPADEHRILASVLACLYRSDTMPGEFLSPALRDIGQDVLLRLVPPDHIAKPADFWGVMDNDLHANLAFVALVPLDPYEPVPFPVVSSAGFRARLIGDEEQRDRFQIAAGMVYAAGEDPRPLEGITVSVEGSAMSALTGPDGRYFLGNLPAGKHRLRLADASGRTATHEIEVPSPLFDIAFAAV